MPDLNTKQQSVVMSEAELSEFERRLQLDGARDPENFEMPDGSTLAEVQGANRERDAKTIEEQSSADRETMRRQTSSLPSEVSVQVLEGGILAASPINEPAAQDEGTATGVRAGNATTATTATTTTTTAAAAPVATVTNVGTTDTSS